MESLQAIRNRLGHYIDKTYPKEKGEGWQQPKCPKPNPKSISRRKGKTPNPNLTSPSKNKETQKTPIETEK
jgi:hypothetical protein